MDAKRDALLLLNERDAMLLHSYIDDELTGADLQQFEARLAKKEGLLLEALAQLESGRAQFRRWHEIIVGKVVADGVRDRNLWRAVQRDIESSSRRYDFKSRVWAFFAHRWVSRLALPAVAVAVFLFVGQGREDARFLQEISGKESTTPRALNMTSRSKLPVQFSGSFSKPQLTSVPFNMSFVKSRKFSDSELESLRQELGFEASSPLVGSAGQRNYPIVIRRWRTSGVDVEWLRSEQAIKILPAVEPGTPPVIWVAANKR